MFTFISSLCDSRLKPISISKTGDFFCQFVSLKKKNTREVQTHFRVYNDSRHNMHSIYNKYYVFLSLRMLLTTTHILCKSSICNNQSIRIYILVREDKILYTFYNLTEALTKEDLAVIITIKMLKCILKLFFPKS